MSKEEDLLFALFNNINRWLEFAEKKNTYIFSFFSLMIIFTPFIGKLTEINCLIKISISIFYFLYVLTVGFTSFSFFPITSISKKIIENGKDKKIRNNDNLIFWGDIYKYSSQEYISALKNKFGIDLKESELLKSLIEQIIINSNITRNKMEYFKRCILFTVMALSQFAICFSINLFMRK
jgi:hypothetical protein